MNVVCSDKRAIASFVCTGSDESHIWKILHGELLAKFNCGTCANHAEKIFNGVHSFVSLGIGKILEKPEYKKAFEEFVAEINLVYNTAKKDGRI